MEIYDIGLAFVWEYDDDFIDLIELAVHKAGLSSFRITAGNINEITELVKYKKLGFNFYLDRASDVNENFVQLGKILTRRKTKIFNPYKNIRHAIDKASMHLEFITNGLEVPYSIIIPPHNQLKNIFISIDELSKLGRPFIIKPCNNTGGGIGVVTGAESLKEVLEERLTNSDDKYILQQKIYPSIMNSRRAWFRSFWAFGRPIPVWWNDLTHIYDELNSEEIKNFRLSRLLLITKKIALITGLDFFSTEIVIPENKKFIVIDYVNDQCDMRIKSKHTDGVPDKVVIRIIDLMVKTIIHDKKLNQLRR
ncbi:MAG: hypothetical protein P4L27_05095 [Ignavibacteriaceae bacterium]|nr:hypothetical protein [Ignavibacteriaceae bacterium]